MAAFASWVGYRQLCRVPEDVGIAGAGPALDLFRATTHRGFPSNYHPNVLCQSIIMSSEEMLADAGSMFSFRGFEIPVDLLNKTGGGVDSFEIISDAHIRLLRQFIELDPKHNVLEIGCGIGRDAIPLTRILRPESRYTGIDIIGRSVTWCTDNIAARFPNFVFAHFDVQDQLHNPGGVMKTTDFVLPCDDNSIDRVILWSVFTHMRAGDIVHYLKEFNRVLKPGGMIFATFFVVNEEIIVSAQATNRTIFDLRFEHLYDDGCFVNDVVHPMGAVAYTVPKLREMVHAGGLSFRYPILFGSWSGLFPAAAFEAGQDAVVLAKG